MRPINIRPAPSLLLLLFVLIAASIFLISYKEGPTSLTPQAIAKEEPLKDQSEKSEGKAAKAEKAEKQPDEKQAEKTPPAGQPTGMPVDAIRIKKQAVQIWNNYSGSVVAVDRAELRPQVSGRITELRFEDGQYVKKGETLIVIDPRPYEAAFKQAEATLATARTRLTLAEKDYERAKELVKKKAVSERLLDERDNAYKVAEAEILRAEALVEEAKINLDYAYVKAPIAGKVSRAEITEGNLVQSGSNAPLLTSIVADEKVYVDFEIDEQTYIKSVRDIPAATVNRIPVRITLSGDTLKYDGFMHSFDNRIEVSSGTIRGRAIFENKDRKLLPGMTVSVEMGSINDDSNKQIIITERAIGTDQDRKFVYIVNEESKAIYREVKLGLSVNGHRIILDGLKEGDVVITSGIVRLRPNTPVAPKLNEAKTVERQSALNTRIATE